MSQSSNSPSSGPINVALCIGSDAIDRLGPILRHLVVGLVNEAVRVRLISTDPRIDAYRLGPVKTLIHSRLSWPLRGRRTEDILESLSGEPPTIVHAVTSESYAIAKNLAETFDADLVLQVTSQHDCNLVGQAEGARVGRYLASAKPLASALEDQLSIVAERVELVRPGVRASEPPNKDDYLAHTPTVVSTSQFEAGCGVEKLVEAVHMLRTREHQVMLFLLGAGRKESALRHMVHQRHLADQVTFAHPTGDLSQAMQSADIFVRPSQDDFLNVEGLQAMGAGMVVVTFPNSVSDFFQHNRTAIVCERTTSQCLAEAMERLLVDRPEALRIATAGIEYVRAHHAMSVMAEKTAAVYRQLAHRRALYSLKE